MDYVTLVLVLIVVAGSALLGIRLARALATSAAAAADALEARTRRIAELVVAVSAQQATASSNTSTVLAELEDIHRKSLETQERSSVAVRRSQEAIERLSRELEILRETPRTYQERVAADIMLDPRARRIITRESSQRVSDLFRVWVSSRVVASMNLFQDASRFWMEGEEPLIAHSHRLTGGGQLHIGIGKEHPWLLGRDKTLKTRKKFEWEERELISAAAAQFQ